MASFFNKILKPHQNPFFKYIKDGNYHPSIFLYLGLMSVKEYRDFIQRLSLEDDLSSGEHEVYSSEDVLTAITCELQAFDELKQIRPEIDYDIMHALVLPLSLKKMEKHSQEMKGIYYPIEFFEKIKQMNKSNYFGSRNSNARNFFFIGGELVCQTLKQMHSMIRVTDNFALKADLIKKRQCLKKIFLQHMKGVPEYFFSLIEPVLSDIYKSEDNKVRKNAYHKILVDGFKEFDDSPIISDEVMEQKAIDIMDTARRAVVYHPQWPLEGCLSGKKELFNGLSDLIERSNPQSLWEGDDCWNGHLYFLREEAHVRN